MKVCAVAASSFLVLLFSSCDRGDLASPLSDVGVVERDTEADAELDVADGSGLSECTLVPQSGCDEGEACVPTGDGLRICVPEGEQELGALCDDVESATPCVAGLLCTSAGGNSARCVPMCSPGGAACSTGSCAALTVVDGEEFGVCL